MFRKIFLILILHNGMFASALERNNTQIQAKERLNSLQKLGIEKNGSVILIDLNQTKNFFESMGKEINKKLKQFSIELKKSVEDQNKTPISLDQKNNTAIIDINKTKMIVENIEAELKKLDVLLRKIGRELGANEKNNTF